MQYLVLRKSDTLQDISRIVGRQNTELVLNENNIPRQPKIGEYYTNFFNNFIKSQVDPEYEHYDPMPDIEGSRKASLLNALTGNDEAFEKACMLDDNEWKFFSLYQSFSDAIKVPESITLPYSDRILGNTFGDNVTIGGNGVVGNSQVSVSTGNSVPSPVYKKVMDSLKKFNTIDPAIFNSVNVATPTSFTKNKGTKNKSNRIPQYAFNIPWGKIQMYSSLLDETIDFPVYPEELDTERSASYTSMPEIIYQYEPWIMYQNSGPRDQSLDFHMHRDLWSGNHLDGKANELIRFCEANTFPRYSGSAVQAPTVKFYIAGQLFISGVLTKTRVNWSGPIGQDGYYLEFKLSLSIQEVSETPLNIDRVAKFGLIGV